MKDSAVFATIFWTSWYIIVVLGYSCANGNALFKHCNCTRLANGLYFYSGL